MASVTDKLLTLSHAFRLYCQREGFVHLRDDEQPTRESTIQRKQLASDFKDNFQQMKMCLRLKNPETGEEILLKPGEWPETPHNAPLAFHGYVIAPHWNSEWRRYNGFEINVVRADFDDWLENEPKYRIQSEMYFQRPPSNLTGEVSSVVQQPPPADEGAGQLSEQVTQAATVKVAPAIKTKRPGDRKIIQAVLESLAEAEAEGTGITQIIRVCAQSLGEFPSDTDEQFKLEDRVRRQVRKQQKVH